VTTPITAAEETTIFYSLPGGFDAFFKAKLVALKLTYIFPNVCFVFYQTLRTFFNSARKKIGHVLLL